MAELFLVADERPAPEMSATLSDAKQRRQALDTRQSFVVEAPAGSGKTGLLIQRYLKLLADDTVEQPEQVLAITFTRKATAELLERVVAGLRNASLMLRDGNRTGASPFEQETLALGRAVLERDRRLGWSLLDQPQRLNIRTIDSVCSQISRSLPLLSGSGGRLSPVDKADWLYDLAARQTFLQLGGPDKTLDEALRTVLLHRDGDLANCEKLVAGMLGHREQWGGLIPLDLRAIDDAWLDEHVLPKIESALEQVICITLTILAKTMPAETLQELTEMAAGMAHLEGYRGARSPLAICAGRHAPPASTIEDFDHWKALVGLLVKRDGGWRSSFNNNVIEFETDAAQKKRLKEFVRRMENEELRAAVCAVSALPPRRYPAEQWIVAKALFRTLKRALVELKLVFAERGECDYTELALAARTALGSEDGPRDLESALGARLQHLLVDEMQDTSSSQYELFELLTEGWDGHSQTVFLVGDPKQSIYLFRQARVERFLRLMRSERLGELELSSLRLTANFRSQETLVEAFNNDFSQVFPTEEDAVHPEEVPYAPVSATRRANATAAGRVWHTKVLPKLETRENHRSKANQRTKDAKKMRSIVAEWRARPLPPGREEPWSIAVLARSRSHLEQIITVFKEQHAGNSIAYRAVEIEPLKERPEVRDLFALTRALLHPADRVAWLSVLRAPWCGLTLADLHMLAGADDRDMAAQSMQRLFAERGDMLATEARERLGRVWGMLQAGVELTGRQPIAEIVERTWRSLGGDAYCQATELANTGHYLELLDELELEAGTIDLETLQVRIDTLYATPRAESGAVDLLTIHNAKGLEWDVVIVPSLERRVGQAQNKLLNWLELDTSDQDAAHILLAPIQGKGEESYALVDWIRNTHVDRETAEAKRLLYVASTRAKEELHLFASPMRSSGGEIKPERGSLLEAAWPAVSPRFDAVAVTAISQYPTEVLPMPWEEEPSGLVIAAAAEGPSPHSQVMRLPQDFNPSFRFRTSTRLSYGSNEDAAATHSFARPEGSFAARAFGNAVHAFLEQMALRLAAQESPGGLLANLPQWVPRIAAVLRAESLPPAAVERQTQRVVVALENTLKDPQGLWAVLPHEAASAELALTAWQQSRSSIRVDRTFRAGSEPMKPGNDCLWIVDYKTTEHGAKGVEKFLEEEKDRYAPQLQAYAEVLAQAEKMGASSIRLALYYPMLKRMLWWEPDQKVEAQQLSLGW